MPVPMTVVHTVRQTADTVTLRLDASRYPIAFQPGQFTMLYALGVGEIPISVSGDPAEPIVLEHTVRAVGAVSQRICEAQVGTQLGVRGPFGQPWPVVPARGADVMFVAGGIGLAPLRPAILHVLANRKDYGDVAILYGARRPEEMLFVDDLHRWRGRFDVQVEVTCDRAGPDWHAPIGVVTRLIHRARFAPDDTVVMTCGPEVMMRFVAQELALLDVPEANIYLSMERNMECAVGWCGHCQLGPDFVCKDGPVFPMTRMRPAMRVREL